MGPIFTANHIICIHDLNYLIAPDSYRHAFRAYYSLVQPHIARNAARVVTVSSYSARMLSNYDFCSLDKITVIPNGHEHVKRWQPLRSQYYSLKANHRPFVFALGSRARHKNIDILFSIAKNLIYLDWICWLRADPINSFHNTIERYTAKCPYARLCYRR